MATICCTTKQPPRALGGNIPTTRAAPDTQNTVRGGEATRLSPTLSPNLARYTKEKPRSARVLGRACDVLEHFASDHAARLDVHGNHEVRLTQHRAGQGKIAAMWWCPLPKGEEKKKTHLARYTLALPSHLTYLHRSWEGCQEQGGGGLEQGVREDQRNTENRSRTRCARRTAERRVAIERSVERSGEEERQRSGAVGPFVGGGSGIPVASSVREKYGIRCSIRKRATGHTGELKAPGCGLIAASLWEAFLEASDRVENPR